MRVIKPKPKPKTEENRMKNKKGKNLKYNLLISSLLISASGLTIELNPEEGLKHLSQNIETSLKNRDEFNKSLVQISQNIATIENSKAELGNQKRKLLAQILTNKNTLSLHTKKLQEIDKIRSDEEKKKSEELNKIVQIEKLLNQLKELQKTRQDRMTQLSIDRSTIEKSQNEGDALQLTLLTETKVIDKRMETLKNEMAPWKTKRKSFEKEASHWNNELERHQKMQLEVKLLIDETT